jgi:ubiquinone/menaquinone biosynthesis C-methylase UbiE
MMNSTPADTDAAMRPYFSGEKLYGDDFAEPEIRRWFEDEAEAYAELGSKQKQAYRYAYHGINTYHGYRHLGNLDFDHALGMGSAYGDEFLPIIQRVKQITILDSSQAFKGSDIAGVPVSYVAADPMGNLPFPDDWFDLITCFGVLHHIPNVSHALREMRRCLASGGTALIREPTASMGDWRQPRPGLTKRERGLPRPLFDTLLAKAGFRVERSEPCFFPVVRVAGTLLNMKVYNSVYAAWLDNLLSRAFHWNYRYYRPSKLAKFAPGCSFWVARK